MDYQNEEAISLRRSFDKARRGPLAKKLASISLKDIPLETRRKEARKPLFLTRYE